MPTDREPWPKEAKAFFAFYWNCLTETFNHSLGKSDLCSSIFGMLVPAIAKLSGASEATMNSLYWQVPLGAFAAFGAVRFLMSPYLIYREIRKRAESAEKALNEKTQAIFEVAKYTIKQVHHQDIALGTDGEEMVVGNTRQCVFLHPKCLTEIPVKECKANIIGAFAKGRESKWERIGPSEGQAPLLKWLNCESAEIVLERHTEGVLSLCYADAGSSQLRPDASEPSNISAMQIPGDYSLDIKISAKDHPPLYISAEITFPGRHFYTLECVLRQRRTLDEEK